MKKITRHYDLFFQLYVPIFLLGCVIAFFARDTIPRMFSVHYVFLFIAFLLIFLPSGRMKLGARSVPKSVGLLQIGLAQAGLFCLFFGFLHLVSRGAPVYTPDMLPSYHSYFKKLFWHWGLFPWGLCALLAVSLSYVGYVSKKPGVFSRTTKCVLGNAAEDSSGISIDFSMRMVSFVCLIVTFGLISMQAVGLVARLPVFGGPFKLGASFEVMITMAIFFGGMQSHFWRKGVRLLLNWGWQPLGVFIVFIIIAAVFVPLLLYATTAFVKMAPPGTQFLSFSLPAKYWLNHTEIMIGMWWLCWMPSISGFIAYVSRGYRVREIILATLYLPALIFLGSWLWEKTGVTLPDSWTNVLGYAATFVGTAIILMVFIRLPYFQHMRAVVLPGADDLKQRNFHNYMPAMLNGIAIVILVYLSVGVFGVSYLLFVLCMPSTIFMGMGALGVWPVLFSRK